MLRSLIAGTASLLISGAAVAMADGPLSQGPTTSPNDGLAMMFSTGPGVGHVDCPADVNEDGQVNVDDLILVIMTYGAIGNLPSDITDDGTVDLLDLLEVIANWGPCPI